MCLYCAERLYRCIRSNKPVTIISVTSHPSDVVEIRMVKENFKARPGQVSQCPATFKIPLFCFSKLALLRYLNFFLGHLKVVCCFLVYYSTLSQCVCIRKPSIYSHNGKKLVFGFSNVSNEMHLSLCACMHSTSF